jgi:hypothetical protein
MDYLLRLLSHFPQAQEQADGWLAPCPCPEHGGDTHPSLRITIGEEGRILIRCRVGCSTESVLGAIGGDWSDLWPGAGENPALPRATSGPGWEDPRLAREWGEVYQRLLALLPLRRTEQDHLRHRQIARSTPGGHERHYGSFTPAVARKALARLQKDFSFSRLQETPGFRVLTTGELTLQWLQQRAIEGLVIALHDPAGSVVGLKLRQKGDTNPRYLALGKPGHRLHVPLGTPGDPESIRVTEGELKAETAWDLSGVPTVSVPGVGSWRLALSYLLELPTQTIRLAFDWPDVQKHASVRQELESFRHELTEMGKVVLLETWDDPSKKGVDDALRAGVVLNALPDWPFGPSRTSALVPSFPGGSPDDLLEPFPLDVLPYSLAELCRQVSRSLHLPDEFSAMSMITVAAGVIGNSRMLSVNGPYTQRACFYTALVAPPGSRKSAMIEYFQRSLYDYTAARTDAEPDILAQDITVESLIEQLASNPRGLLISHDELTAWVRNFNAYRQKGIGADRQFFLSAWSGSPHKYRRKGSSCFIRRVTLSILGAVTPDCLHELDESEGREDGFADRILFLCPEVRPPQYLCREVPDPQLVEIWDDLLLWLLERDPDDPGVLQFSAPAELLFETRFNEHLQKRMDPDFPPRMVGAWAKLEAYFPRLILVLHLLLRRDFDHPVEEETVDAAWKILQCLASHLRKSRGIIQSRPNDALIYRLVNRMTVQNIRELSLREIQRFLRTKTRSEVDRLLTRAEDLGLGERVRLTSRSQGFRLGDPEGGEGNA